jgi:GT2 family glycosyltransferase
MSSCAVVIPTYDGGALVRTCLEAILASPPQVEYEIIVVDDGSHEDTERLLSACADSITLVRRSTNGGFARACNEGAAAARPADYLVFLNNDTIPLAGWLDALVTDADVHPSAAMVGAKLLFPNGTIQHAGVVIGQDRFPHHVYAGFPEEHPAVNRSRPVQAVTAACALIRRQIFDAAGGFDTSFHNGYEDIDLCLRVGLLGHEIRYCAASVLYHLEAVTRWPAGHPPDTAANDKVYRDRWAGRVRPDDLEHYAADGLLHVEYGRYYPVSMTVSPLLAAIDPGSGRPGIEQLLAKRSEQVMDLMVEQIRTHAGGNGRARPARARLPASSASGLAAGEVIARGATHQLGDERPRHLVSVVMPLKNDAARLSLVLPLILAQRAPALLEIIGVVSGSSDGTIDVLRDFQATVIAIEPDTFNHGLTRNLGADHARGDMLLFVNGRSRPVGDAWLRALIVALEADPLVAGACSRVLPYPDAHLLTVRDGYAELSGSPERRVKRITDWATYVAMPTEVRREFLNFHTVSALIRADVLARIPFRRVRAIGEDLLWAREVLEGGYALVHEPASVVHHSHDYSLRGVLERNVDDGIANADINGRCLTEDDVLATIRAMVAQDWSYLKDQVQLSGAQLEEMQIHAVVRRCAQMVGQWLGVHSEDLPPEMIAELSRVERIRRG